MTMLTMPDLSLEDLYRQLFQMPNVQPLQFQMPDVQSPQVNLDKEE